MNKAKVTQIHPTAVVSKEAQIAEGVTIGPYSIIGPHLRIESGTTIGSHAVLEGHTVIGERCKIFTGACFGTPPQDKKLADKPCHLKIGDDNIFREYTTVNGGSPETKTVIGDRNFLMIASHVAHDCVLGNDITLANSVALGGHVVVGDKAVIGGLTAVHQFCRIGKLAMIGGETRITMDVLPYSLCYGNPARAYGLNSVGLKRAGYTSKDSLLIKKALRILSRRGISVSSTLDQLASQFNDHPDIQYLKSFIQKSERGITRGFLKAEKGGA